MNDEFMMYLLVLFVGLVLGVVPGILGIVFRNPAVGTAGFFLCLLCGAVNMLFLSLIFCVVFSVILLVLRFAKHSPGQTGYYPYPYDAARNGYPPQNGFPYGPYPYGQEPASYDNPSYSNPTPPPAPCIQPPANPYPPPPVQPPYQSYGAPGERARDSFPPYTPPAVSIREPYNPTPFTAGYPEPPSANPSYPPYPPFYNQQAVYAAPPSDIAAVYDGSPPPYQPSQEYPQDISGGFYDGEPAMEYDFSGPPENQPYPPYDDPFWSYDPGQRGKEHAVTIAAACAALLLVLIMTVTVFSLR